MEETSRAQQHDENTKSSMELNQHHFSKLAARVDKLEERIPYQHRESHEDLENRVSDIEENCDGHSRYQKFEQRVNELEQKISELERQASRAETVADEVADEWSDILRGEDANVPERELKRIIREVIQEEMEVEISF